MLVTDDPWIPAGLWPNKTTAGFTSLGAWLAKQRRLAARGDEAAKRRLDTHASNELFKRYMETRRQQIGPD